jgi:hypothetical protein
MAVKHQAEFMSKVLSAPCRCKHSGLTLQASLESKTKALRRAEQAVQQRAEHAQHELAVARRECDRSAGDAEDRKVQLSVLVETVETLQAGTPGETHAAIPFFS